jgi:hypothetical protein
MPLLLLKARPTPSQLDDRLRAPLPDGLELYLDTADLADEAAMDGVVANLSAHRLPSDFALLIEGPVRSLDGQFFDLAREAEADREVVRRLALLAGRIGARAVNVHAIAPSADPQRLTQAQRAASLEQALGLARFFADQIAAAGAIPTIENMPPILRMREGGFYYSAIGMPAEDLVWLCERSPGLRTTMDFSHAGLYLTARVFSVPRSRFHVSRSAPGTWNLEPGTGVCPELFDFVRELPPVADLPEYAEALGATLLTCHVSNASGILGEGEPFDRGDYDLGGLVAHLEPRVTYFVTETLEADPDRAINMKRALEAMREALVHTPSRSGSGLG